MFEIFSVSQHILTKIETTHLFTRILGREAKALVFADSRTYSGRDENPLFDGDDELALMARHRDI